MAAMVGVQSGKVHEPETGFWKVWVEDRTRKVWIGEYLDAAEAEAVARRAQRRGVVEAERVWEQLLYDRVAHTFGVYYYPLLEAENGEEFSDGLWWVKRVGWDERGYDLWCATCSRCQAERRFGTKRPPFNALWPWKALPECDHAPPPPQVEDDEEMEYIRLQIERRWGRD